MPDQGNDVWESLEQSRLGVFAAHGFDGRSKRIPDRKGRETYAIVRNVGQLASVLIHGGLGDASEWSTLAANLDGTLVILDRPGYGLTYRIDYRKVDFRRAASDWLQDVVEGLGVERVNLIGASMGGFFAMAFAAAHPDRVKNLILVGAPVGLYDDTAVFLRLWANPIVGRLISRMKISDAEMLRKRAFTGLVVHPERIPHDMLEVALTAMRLPGTALTTRTMLNAATSLRGLRPELRMRDDIAHVDVRTLFVWGDQDRVAPSSIGDELARQMSDARLAVIEDAGHDPHHDDPQGVAAVVNSFLARA